MIDRGSRADTLVLGVGNPILSDDAVGLVVARLVHGRLARGRAELAESSLGGLELLDLLEGWRRVLLIDSLEPGRAKPGELVELPWYDLGRDSVPLTPHYAGLHHCVALGRACGLRMPEEVVVFGIGVRDTRTFSESLTPEVAARVPDIVESLTSAVFAPGGRFAAG